MDGKKIQDLSFTKLELRIVKYVFRHYNERFTPRALARALMVNHAHVNGICGLLHKKNLLTKEDIGNADYYRFNHKNPLALKFMEYLISLEENMFPEWLTVLANRLNQFEPFIHFGCVFGSSLKDKEHNDIDILIVYDKHNSKKIEEIKTTIRVSELIEKPIRYLDMSRLDIPKNKNDPIFYSIMSECIVFCHAEKYVEAIKNVTN